MIKEQKGSVFEKKEVKLKTNKNLKDYYKEKWKKNDYQRGYIRNDIDFSKRYDKERKKAALKFLNPKKEEIILDAGCGKGEVSIKIAKKAKLVYAVDLTKEAFKKSKRNPPRNLVFKEMNLENLKFKNEFFDKIICIETLEHVLHYNKVLSEFHRVLKHNGKLIITYPFVQKTNIRKIEIFLGIQKKGKITEHITEWDYKEVKKHLEGGKFKVINEESIAFDWGHSFWFFAEKSKRLTRHFFEKGLKIKNKPHNSFFSVFELEKI